MRACASIVVCGLSWALGSLEDLAKGLTAAVEQTKHEQERR